MKIDLSKLRELREKAELTRRELADRIGCREFTIYRWENDKTQRPLPIYQKALSDFYKENGNWIKNSLNVPGLNLLKCCF